MLWLDNRKIPMGSIRWVLTKTITQDLYIRGPILAASNDKIGGFLICQRKEVKQQLKN